MVNIPVIAIDGPIASGKGTIAQGVAKYLGFYYLDSGALYRLIALLAIRRGIAIDSEQALIKIAENLHHCFFNNGYIYLALENVTQEIRTEKISNFASKIAIFTKVRQALHTLQLSFCKLPGLVADGRDMGTVIFPHAILKIYLTAKIEIRVQRRYQQLIDNGFSVTIKNLLKDLCERDTRDMYRILAPLKSSKESYVLDTSHMSIDEVIKKVLDLYLALL